MKKIFLLLPLFWLFSGCTIYKEKQSEAVSRTVYATKDSLDMGRIDLADEYATQTTRLINPPKERVEISPIYESKPSTATTKAEKVRTVIVPDRFRNDKVIVVNSQEYQSLLQDKEAGDRLRADNARLLKDKKFVDEEIQKQIKNADKMVTKINQLEKEVLKKNLIILRLSIAVTVLTLVIAGYIYLRFQGGGMLGRFL